MIYLDNQTESQTAKEVVAAMLPFLSKHSFAISSIHPLAEHARACAKDAINELYHLLQAKDEDNFILTSSHTEAINQVVLGCFLSSLEGQKRNHFLTSKLAEAPQVLAMSRLKTLGADFEMIEVDKEGNVTVEALEESITPRTCLLSLSWANGLTGVIQPLDKIAELCHKRGVLLHIDATHVLGKGSFDFATSHADFFTFNGEQLQGPRASGGLFVREGVDFSPLIAGGKEQGELRAGRVDVATLVGLCKAVELAKKNEDHCSFEILRLRDLFEGCLADFSSSPFKSCLRLPNISLLLFPGVTSDALAYYLGQKELYASIGGNLFQKISHLLSACGVEGEAVHTGVSFSFAPSQKEDEIRMAASLIRESVRHLQKLTDHLVLL